MRAFLFHLLYIVVFVAVGYCARTKPIGAKTGFVRMPRSVIVPKQHNADQSPVSIDDIDIGLLQRFIAGHSHISPVSRRHGNDTAHSGHIPDALVVAHLLRQIASFESPVQLTAYPQIESDGSSVIGVFGVPRSEERRLG